MKRLILFALLLLSTAAFTSCNNDSHRELNLDEILLGRVWSGDLGFYDDIGPLESVVLFGERGVGYDQNHDPKTGKPIYDRLDFQWRTYDRGTTVYLKYLPSPIDGNIAPRELRNVYYDYLSLTGELFIGEKFYRRVTLIMQL